MSTPFIPEIGKTCPGLTDEDYDTKLSGDCARFCNCLVTGKACIGRHIEDTEDASNHFFSRARCHMNQDKLEACPMYGMPPEMFIDAIQIKGRIATEKKLAGLKSI